MLHTKFHGHRPFGSGEEDFLRYLPYMVKAAILSCDQNPRRLHMKFGFNRPGGFRGEDILKQLTYDIRRTAEACLYCKLTSGPKHSEKLSTGTCTGMSHFLLYA